MTLRGRLALTLVLTAVPLVVGLGWLHRELIHRSEVQFLRDLVLKRVAWLGRERCEAAPEDLLALPPMRGPERPPAFAGPPPAGPRQGPPRHEPVQSFAYDAGFRSSDPEAPAFPEELKRGLDGGSDFASRRFETALGRGEAIEVALRTGWNEGRCAVILLRRLDAPAPPPMSLLTTTLPLLAALIAAVLLASGPVVERIRALTGDVRRSAETRYETPVRVTGSDEVAELARAFNEAGARVRAQMSALEERDRTLRAFLANTTHDVMIPLTVLLGHLSGFRKRLADGGGIEEAQLLPAIQEAQYLASLLQNLSAAAKLEAGEPLIERHPVDLNALVERVVERHRPVAAAGGVALEYGVPEQAVVAFGDVTLIEQAVSNIVHNAVRYNHTGGHVAVLLEETPPASFRLRVVDDGPGVPEAELQRLVERRRRGDEARRRQPGGLGLGLSIVHGVAERHGFAMRLSRSEQGGLAVDLTGPRGTSGAGPGTSS